MSVTIRDIAKKAGVSIAAVSKALNNRGGISLPVKLKIERIAKALNYSPYINARKTGMLSGPSKHIGIIYAFAGEHLIREIQNGMDSVLTDSGYLLTRFNLNSPGQTPDEVRKEYLVDKITEDKSVAGIIAVFVKIADATVAKLQKSGIPVVQLNNYTSYGKCVYVDNKESAYNATKTLIKLGRKHIGLIMPEEVYEDVWQQRLDGYKKALVEANIDYNPYLTVYEHQFSLSEAARATKTLLEREPKIDAIIYGSDIQAYGGLEALKTLNKRVPDDIAVLGFDNMPFSEITYPPLTSIAQPMFEMGKDGAQLMLDSIKSNSHGHKAIKLNGELVLRQSTHKDIPREKLI